MIKCVRVLHHRVVWLDPVDSWLNPNNLFVQSVHTLQIPKCILNMIYSVAKTVLHLKYAYMKNLEVLKLTINETRSW